MLEQVWQINFDSENIQLMWQAEDVLLYCIFLLANVGDLPEYFQIPKIVYLCFFVSPHSTVLWWNYAYLCQIVSIFMQYIYGNTTLESVNCPQLLSQLFWTVLKTQAYRWMSAH